MSLSYRGVFKLPLFYHSNFYHHLLRPHIMHGSKGINFVKPECIKSIFKACFRGLGGKTMVPVCFAQAPADFNTGGKIALKAGVRQAGKADELMIVFFFNSKKSITVLLNMICEPPYLRKSFISCRSRWKKLHHVGILVQRYIRLMVR